MYSIGERKEDRIGNLFLRVKKWWGLCYFYCLFISREIEVFWLVIFV